MSRRELEQEEDKSILMIIGLLIIFGIVGHHCGRFPEDKKPETKPVYVKYEPVVFHFVE